MSVETLTLPRLNAELWDHQREAFHRAAHQPGYLLGHDMGTGKGATTVALLEHDQATRVLILCPKNVVGVWPAQLNGPIPIDDPDQPGSTIEIPGFSPRTWHVWSGRVIGARGPKKNPSVEERATALLEANTQAIKLGLPFAAVVNYEASHLGQMRDLLLGTDWDALVCDESHRIKKPSGKASRLAGQIGGRVRARGGRVLCDTGTPMPHSPLDLWAQMRAVDGGDRLGTSYRRFCQRFGKAEEIYVGYNRKRTVYKDLRDDRREEFDRLVGEVMDVVSADDVLDLPDATDRFTMFELGTAAQRAYDELERHGIHEAHGGTLTAANAMVLLLRLAQVTSGFGKDADTDRHVPLDPDGTPDKARALADVLEDIHVREPVVIFARFHADLDAIRQVCERTGRRYGELSGRAHDGLTDDDPPRMSPHIDVLGAQLQSGGVGIDLTRARIAIYYSQDFRLADYAQSRRRLVRPGQTRPVAFVHLLAKDTVDEAVYGALRKRQEVVDAVIRHLKEGASP